MCLPSYKTPIYETNTKIAATPPAASKGMENILLNTDNTVNGKKYLKGNSLLLESKDSNTNSNSSIML